MINLEVPKKLRVLVNQARQTADNVFRPISRKYDKAEHDYPIELDMFAAIMDGMNDALGDEGAGSGKLGRSVSSSDEIKNGINMTSVLGLAELCRGDVGLSLTMPRQGLGNSAIAAVANDEQLARFGNKWAAMAITEPGCGSDSAAVRTTAMKDGDDYIINGEKIFVTSGERADAVVVWATVDKALGKAAIKSFVVEKGTPGMEVTRLEKKLGIKASDTASISFNDCRVPRENLLGTEEVSLDKGFSGVMQTFDNTRPVVAAMAVGVASASIERTKELLKKQGAEILQFKSQIKKLKLTEKELNKASGLKVAFEQRGIDTSKVIAVGDASNDIPMFEMCGFSVAVNNEFRGVEEAANYLTKAKGTLGTIEFLEEFIMARK